MNNFEENLRKYYSSKNLRDDKVDLLLGGENSKRMNLPGYFKYAAAVIIIITFTFGYLQFTNNKIELSVAKEIAMNHSKQLEVEYTADNLNELENKLSKLEFKLSNIKSELNGKYNLLGGRYCSIQGNLAAQLKLKNLLTDKIETLYVSKLNDDLNKLSSSNMNMDGVNIRVWKKDGLLYGRASDI